MIEEDYPELAFMSPNEKAKFIKDTLLKKKRERMLKAKQQFSEFTKERSRNFANKKFEHEKKNPKNISKEELEKTKREIDSLRIRIEKANQGVGFGHINAEETVKTLEENDIKRELKAEESQKHAQVLFKQAIEVHRQNDPRIPMELRKSQLKKAINNANARENTAIHNFSQELKQRAEQEKAQEMKYQQEEREKMRPKLNINDYANTYLHSGLGILPVNQDAVDYGKMLENSEENKKKDTIRNGNLMKKRTFDSAYNHNFEKDANKLQSELRKINKFEIDQTLESLKTGGDSKIEKHYCIDERKQKKQETMKHFWESSEEGPKPRLHPPKPEPINYRPSSPVESESED